MKEGVPFIAFSVQEGDDHLYMTLLDSRAVERKKPAYEDTFLTLAQFNERGLEESATMIGKLVLATLQRSNPAHFTAYPKLVVEVRPAPTREQLAATDAEIERQDRLDPQQGTNG